MNYQKAKEIVENSVKNGHLVNSRANDDYYEAQGYLEAHAKAEKLVEALEKQLDSCAYPKMDCAVCKEGNEALTEWHKENKEGE